MTQLSEGDRVHVPGRFDRLVVREIRSADDPDRWPGKARSRLRDAASGSARGTGTHEHERGGVMARQIGYGAFPGGDPRTFTPDPECSTEQEREAHRRACAIYEAHGRLPPMDPDHIMGCDETTGTLLIHIARSRFGLGVYEYDDGEGGEEEEPPTDEAWDEEVLRGLTEDIQSALESPGRDPAHSGDTTGNDGTGGDRG